MMKWTRVVSSGVAGEHSRTIRRSVKGCSAAGSSNRATSYNTPKSCFRDLGAHPGRLFRRHDGVREMRLLSTPPVFITRLLFRCDTLAGRLLMKG